MVLGSGGRLVMNASGNFLSIWCMRSAQPMRIKLRLPAATWTLGDQTVVSLGSFVANMVIARNFPPAEYGTFSLIMLLVLALSTVTGSVLLYPMSVRATVAVEADRGEVFG